jgi:long-chain acyl-CoA synthetase
MIRAQSIGEMFLASSERHGSREALVFRDTRWTYRELRAGVGAAQRVLTSLAGAVPTRIAIVGANHPAYVMAYFGAQTLGASTVEIGRDEALTAVRAAILATGAQVIVTDRADLIADAPVAAIGFNEFVLACETETMRETAEPYPTGVTADALASIVYTSGTTGSPKGVMLSHGNFLFVAYAVCEYLALSPEDRYALVLPIAHTYGKSNLLSTLAAGATVVFVEQPQNPAAFFGTMMEERCTVLSVVPFHLNVLARHGVPPAIDLRRLRAITTSGGPLPAATVNGVTNLLPHAQLFSMYGLTESSTRVTYMPPAWLPGKLGSVGRPLPGVRVEIRADDGQVLPIGQVGHVFVHGPNVMQGYFGDAALTAETLVHGWLRTGDIGYLDVDDCLFLTGREKEIIKVAGERISPAEIEEVLLSHPAVAEAAVVGVPDALLGESVWAYVILNPGGYDTAEISAFCAAQLSPHKVPRRFIEIDRIPRTPTGKIRRHMLASV